MLRLSLLLALLSLAVMLLVDRALGPRAELLNAWSVLQRLLGRAPSAGASLVAQRAGALGELFVVVAVNLGFGTLLAALSRLVLSVLR